MRVLRPDEGPPARLPRGRHASPAAVVVAVQRARLLDAMTEQVAEHGLAATRVADVVAGAGVSLSSFYACFADKSDCFMAAYDAVGGALVEQIEAVAGDQVERISGGIAAYLDWFAIRPAAARAYLVEVHAVGARGLRARTAVIERLLAVAMRSAGDEIDAGRMRAFLLTVDALAHEEVVAGRTAGLPQLHPGLVDLAVRMLAP